MILILNYVCLFYIKCGKELQLSHLVFVYGKAAVFVPKSGKIVAKIKGVTSSYKEDTPIAKSDISEKEKSELLKGIDWIHCVQYYSRNKDRVDCKVSA